MDSLTESIERALAQGVRLNDTTVRRIPGRGLGIIGEKTIKVRQKHFCAALSSACPDYNGTLASVG
jgi:hypothetical protein